MVSEQISHYYKDWHITFLIILKHITYKIIQIFKIWISINKCFRIIFIYIFIINKFLIHRGTLFWHIPQRRLQPTIHSLNLWLINESCSSMVVALKYWNHSYPLDFKKIIGKWDKFMKYCSLSIYIHIWW